MQHSPSTALDDTTTGDPTAIEWCRASGWCRPPEDLVLAPQEVHVWRATLDGGPIPLECLTACLSPDELERARRFHFPHDRERFVAARGTLRHLLARYLDLPPQALRFRANRWGKPALVAPSDAPPLRFNLSHSGGIALYVLAIARRVGVDVEAIRPAFACAEVVEQFFSPAERIAWRALPPASQTDAFFACWTRKEAFMKGDGRGVSLPPTSFAVAVEPADPRRVRGVAGDPAATAGWELRDLPIELGYAAALAVHGSVSALRLWQWSA